MKQLDLHLPADVLRSLLDGKQTNVPYTLSQLPEGLKPDEPLRIVLWVSKPQPQTKKFGGRA